jgi:transposase
MLDEATRTAILKLKSEGHSARLIAKAVGVSRFSVAAVIKHGEAAVPAASRDSQVQAFREQILELYSRYEGHLVRVHEALTKDGARFSYSTLTAFCRKHEIGHAKALPAGRYTFKPGEEMQHDTSPHQAKIAGTLTPVQTASLVLCHSRMIYFQHYPRFTRFECKAFLTAGMTYFGGAASVCMIDNSHVVVAAGSGAHMIPAPEMVAFAERFGFKFQAHEKGDANRSARVEAPFNRIDKGFLTGEDFADWNELNRRARQMCDQWNAAFSNKLHASRRELFAAERPQLKPLPLFVPQVYQIHTRSVDSAAYIHLNRIRYSAPWRLIGRTLEVRETLERVELYDGPRRVADHARLLGPVNTYVTDPAHRPPRGEGRVARKSQPAPEEIEALQLEPRIESYLKGLKQHAGSRRVPLRRFLTMLQEYPRQAFLTALAEAERYRLFDLDRLEKMVLRQIAADYFVLSFEGESDDDQ